MKSFTPWLITIIMIVVSIILGKIAFELNENNISLSDDINQLQSSLSIKPKIIKIDSIVYNDRIYNIFKTPKISQDNTAAKILAVGDRKKLDSLNKILGITTKDLLSYREINTNLLIQNQKLKNSLSNPTKMEYKDDYINLVIDRETNNIDTLSHKISLTSVTYDKRPKWYKGKEEFYTLSLDDKRVTMDVTGFDTKPKVLKSMLYLDNNYSINPKTLSNGNLNSTINYEWGTDNVLSSYIGGGVQTNFTGPINPIVNVGVKVNLYRKRK